MQREPVGIAWYAREDYAHALTVMDDADRLPASFEEWLERAAEVAHELGRQGFDIVRVALRPDEFVAWCRDNDMAPDGDARSVFAAEGAERRAAADARPKSAARG